MTLGKVFSQMKFLMKKIKFMSKEQELMEQVNGAVIEKNEIISTRTVEGTPFKIIDTEKGAFIGFGRYRVSELTTVEDCRKIIEDKEWELLLSVVNAIVAEEILLTKKN